MKIDEQLLRDGVSMNGGWNSRQIELLGLTWPPEKGWQRKVIGRHISEEDRKSFIEARGLSFRKSRVRKPRAPYKVPEPVKLAADGFIIYSDGGALKQKGKGAWAYVKTRNGIQIEENSQAYCKTTSNRMEIMGALAGIQSTPLDASVVVRSDSQYVVHAMQRGWADRWAKNMFRMGDPKLGGKRPNWDLWMQLMAECSRRKVQFEWVRGHSGDRLNEKCDRLAALAMKGGPFHEDLVFNKLLLENNGKW